MNRPTPIAARQAAMLLLPALLTAVFLSSRRASAASSCQDLARLSVADTTITSAEAVAAGAFTPPGGRGGATGGFANLPAFCRVAATLRPSSDSDIKIEVWLPASGWNGKLQAVGQGGLAGSIPYPEMAAALGAGYATSGTDTGHAGDSAEFVPGHPEKLIDFAYRAIHEMAVKGKAMIAARYGSAPTRSYFNGCSGGGRHGLTSAQRYPADFDGIVAGASSWNQPRMDAARIAVNRIVNRTPESGIPPSKLPMIHDAVLQACDGLDGVKDGVIENPTRCRFDVRTLECTGTDGPTCLTAPQVESARALLSSLRHPTTGAMLFEGHLWPGAELEWGRLSQPEPPNNVLTRIRNITFKNPNWDLRQFNIATDVDLADKVDNGLLASSNFNLEPFFDRGGKLLMWHGWADPQVTPQNSIIYYNSVVKTVGKNAERSIALFMLPGVSHCQGGPGPDTFDKMSGIEQWVEQGKKPTRFIASHRTGGKVDRTRPLCPYGQVAKWKGSGSTEEAVNFSCIAESMETK
jgi:feruloyl esterase